MASVIAFSIILPKPMVFSLYTSAIFSADFMMFFLYVLVSSVSKASLSIPCLAYNSLTNYLSVFTSVCNLKFSFIIFANSFLLSSDIALLISEIISKAQG